MAPLFWLEITDWKKEIDQVEINNQQIYSYFSSNDWKKTQVIRDSLNSLKYFNNEAELDINKMRIKFNELSEKIRYVKYNQFKLFSDFKNLFSFCDYAIITSRSIVSKIMNTPFEINQKRREWIIYAQIYRDNRIYLSYRENNEDVNIENMDKQYQLLKRYLFVKYPVNYHRKVTSAFDEIFGELIRLRIGTHDLFYITELAGIISDQKITKCEQLNTAEHVYCDIYKSDSYSSDVINYNPIWWSKAVLIKAKQCIIASYDEDNDNIKQLHKFTINKFDDKAQYENLWSQNAAWNFLKEFLQFVKDSVKSVPAEFKKQSFWKFQSFPNNKSHVSCEIFIRQKVNGQETVIPVDETTF